MVQWEYQVIHLNVDNGKPGETPKAPPSPPPSTPTPFTQTYLEQEFPEHYSSQNPKVEPTAAPQGQQHPAQQLQTFFNGHGAKGWCLIGIFPVGQLLMIVMRRRLVPQQGAAAEPVPSPDAAPQPGLEQVLERLAALEQRLAAGPVTEATAASPGIATGRDPDAGSRTSIGSTSASGSDRPIAITTGAAASTGRPGVQDGSVLPAAELQALDHQPALTGREAAEALGYRSSASLSNLGNRMGYPPGLVKQGVNGKAAVYRGLGGPGSGGKPQRLWVVVPQSSLEG